MNNPGSSIRIPGTLSNLDNLEDNHNIEDLDIHSKFLPCIKTFQKSTSDRGYSDLATIIDTLKCFKFLHSSSDNVVKTERAFAELARIVKYQYIDTQKTIFHKGDTEDKIYLILHGTVVIFSEVTGEVFKVNVASVEEPKEDKVIEKTLNNQSQSKILIRSMTGDEQVQKALFQPKMNRKFCRQQTSIGDINSTFSSTVAVPTVHELKKALHDNHPGTTNVESNIQNHFHPHHHHHHLHHQNNNESQESPTWAQREAKKKLALYKLLFKADKERPGKYIKEGKFLFEMKKKLSPGSHFGDTVSRLSKVKDTTAIALEGLHILSFSMEDYVKLFNHHPDNPHNNLRFLEPFFPDASYPKLLKLMNLFEECEYWQRQIIFEEGAAVEAMYFIKEGEVQLLKGIDLSKHLKEEKTSSPNNMRRRCYLATLGKGEVLAEDDIFFGEKVRHYSAVVTSGKLVVLKMNAEVYNKINETYKELFTPLRKAAKVKKNFHQEQVKNISMQVLNSAQQIEDFKWKSKQSTPGITLKDVKLSRELSPTPTILLSEDKSPKKIKNRLDNSNKSNFSSPKNLTSQKTLLMFDRRESALFSNDGSPNNKERRIIRDMTDSPLTQIKSTNALSTLADIDKRESEPVIFPKPCPSKQERVQTPSLNDKKSSSKLFKPKRVVDFNSPLADKFSSLYKRALGHVKRKKVGTSVTTTKPKLSSSIGENQAPYDYDELQRSIQNILYKTGRASLSPEGGFISLEGSPVAKHTGENRPKFVLESLLNRNQLERMSSPKQILHSSASTDKLRTKGDKTGFYNSRTSKRVGIDLNISQLSPERINSSNLVTRIHSPNYPSSVNGTKTPTYVAMQVNGSFIKKRKDEEQDSEEALSIVDSKSKSHVKLNQLLSKLEVDVVDPTSNRVGWKAGKKKSVKIKYRYYANRTEKGEKIST